MATPLGPKCIPYTYMDPLGKSLRPGRSRKSAALIPSDLLSFTLRVQVPNNEVLGIWVIVIIVQVLGKYMIIRYLDP